MKMGGIFAAIGGICNFFTNRVSIQYASLT